MALPDPIPPTEIGKRVARHEPPHVRDIVRVTCIGLVANILLAICKMVGGLLGSSQAIVADGVNSLSDTITDVAVLVGVRYWTRAADEEHNYGHGRIETIITSFIAATVLAVAVGLAWTAVVGLHAQKRHSVELIAFAAGLVSIVTKEFLYHWTVRVGREQRSPAVIAKAWDHRSDVFSSIPATLAVLIAVVRPDWWFLDHVGAMIVSVFIFRTGLRIGWPAIQQLVDIAAPEQARERIRKIAEETPGVRLVHALRTRYAGSGLQVDLHIKVDPLLTVREGHDISELVKKRLLAEGPDVVDVIVHLEPFEKRHEKR
jgi:cation diffusion facilitator family transporter